jgi:hypothetical protein
MMKAGRYYVGDLCYVMSDTEWGEVCSITIVGNECIQGEFTLSDGRKFAMYNTRWGDGQYRSNRNTKHSVDSGTIGCILLENIEAHVDEENKFDFIEDVGALIEFKKDFETYSADGLMVFGDVIINTDPDDFYEEEDEYEYE